MNRLSMDKKVAVISALCEGCSVRSTSRLTGVAKGTILRLLAEVGAACAAYQNRVLRNIRAQRVQVDEIWSFVGAKQKNVTAEMAESRICGDVWTFVAIEAHAKLVISWLVGRRDAGCATDFLRDVESRLANPIQLTTDGHKMYLSAVPDAFAFVDIDYAQLVKIYGTSRDGEQRYSPPEVTSAIPHPVLGLPDVERICTSHVERQNLTMRMGIRRLTRLTNAFSKKWENLKAALALWFAFYNFCRSHKSIRMTPAMSAGITDHIWSISELLEAVA